MSNVKLADLCADCCAANPTWASLSLGVLLCSRCALVHLGLGQHFPQIVSLQDKLPTKQRELLEVLSANNMNSVWEHYLLDSSYTGGGRKPSPHDQNLHPIRSSFIESKYIQLNFMERLPHDATETQVNIRLMSNVRTSDVEESLKLIIQGADVRYVHPETRSTQLHTAVNSGQSLQVELLLIHGADPRAEDGNGRSAIDVAKAAGRLDLVSQMTAALNQLAEKLQTFAASSETLPNAPSLDLNDEVRAELCQDLYDEVERREVLKKMACDEVPFLPVNKAFSTVRNQSRQKLARLSKQELATLITHCIGQDHSGTLIVVDEDDDEPLYDSVCGDDDLISQKSLSITNFPAPVSSPTSLPPPPPAPAPSHNEAAAEPPIFYPNLLVKTEEITKHTHSLLIAAQEQNDDCYLSICNQIRASVLQMSYLVPPSYPEQACREALQALLTLADNMVQNGELLVGGDKPENAQKIIMLAYNVARGVKKFVTSFPHIRNSNKMSSQLTA